MINTVGDNRNHDIIGHELAKIHEMFDAQPRSRA
jgi:hypothetical protein